MCFPINAVMISCTEGPSNMQMQRCSEVVEAHSPFRLEENNMQPKERNKSKELDIEYYFYLNIKVMSLIGLRCNGPTITGFVHRIPTYVANTLGVIYFISQIFLVSDPEFTKDKRLVLQTVSQSVSNIQCITKGFLFAASIEKLQVIYNDIKFLCRKYPPNDDIRVLIFNLADQTMNFSKYYMMAICSVILSYYMPIAINIASYALQGSSTNHTYDFTRRIFYLKYPFAIDTAAIYSMILSLEAVFLIAQTFFWVDSDTLFAQITTHLCLQYKVLKNDVQNAFNSEGSKSKDILIGLIRRHRELIRICMLTEEIFSPMIFFAMLLSSINMCFHLVGASAAVSDGSYSDTGIYATMLLITVFQIFFFCVYAERITEETRSLADTVYNLNWAIRNSNLRFYILLVIMRAQKPFYCTAYGFFPIGHEKLTSIISTAFSYYMMLRTTSDK